MKSSKLSGVFLTCATRTVYMQSCIWLDEVLSRVFLIIKFNTYCLQVPRTPGIYLVSDDKVMNDSGTVEGELVEIAHGHNSSSSSRWHLYFGKEKKYTILLLLFYYLLFLTSHIVSYCFYPIRFLANGRIDFDNENYIWCTIV